MYEKILKVSNVLKSKFFFDYDIYKYTWFRTGGKTDIFCIVENENELEIILKNIGNIPYFIIGAGSNLLIRDGGFKGIIIKLGKGFNHLSVEDDVLLAGASILDLNLSKFAFLNSIKNLEFFSGIPGSIGGAIKMNAGCFGTETKDLVKSIKIMDKTGDIKNLDNKDLNFKYRKSNLKKDIVLDAKFEVKYGDKEEIDYKIKKIKNRREISQPIKSKTSGSTFKNPKGLYAAKLIEMANCKGLKIGGAVVSNQHANFIINLNNATAGEIESLGKSIFDKVYNKFNVALEWEIKIIGESS